MNVHCGSTCLFAAELVTSLITCRVKYTFGWTLCLFPYFSLQWFVCVSAAPDSAPSLQTQASARSLRPTNLFARKFCGRRWHLDARVRQLGTLVRAQRLLALLWRWRCLPDSPVSRQQVTQSPSSNGSFTLQTRKMIQFHFASTLSHTSCRHYVLFTQYYWGGQIKQGKWAGHAARVVQISVYKTFVWKPESKKSHRRHRRRYEDYIKSDLGYEDVTRCANPRIGTNLGCCE